MRCKTMNAMKLKFEIKHDYKKNKRNKRFLFRKIEELKKQKKIREYKNIDFILEIIWDYLKKMLFQIIYFICCIYLPMHVMGKENDKIYLLYNIIFLNILFGNLKDSYIYSYGYDRHFCISFLKINMKKYVMDNFYYEGLKQIITFGIGILLLFHYYNLSLKDVFVLLMYTSMMRFISEALHVYYYQKKDSILCSKIGYDLVILLFCGIGYFPLFYNINYTIIINFIDLRIGLLAIIVSILMNHYITRQEFVSFSFMECFRKRKSISAIYANEMNREKKSSDLEGLTQESVVLDNLNQKMDISYLNQVFFTRYHAYFFNIILLRSIFAFVISTITSIYLYFHMHSSTQWNILFPILFIEIFLLSSADQFYRKIYERCDSMFVDFYIYFSWEIQKENIFVRLKKCMKDNVMIMLSFFVPLLVGNLLIGRQVVEIIILLSAICLFFIYTLVYQTLIYYLIEPYGKKELFNWKNWIASIFNVPLYICIFHFSRDFNVFLIFMLLDISLLMSLILKLVPKYQIKAFHKNE